MSDLKFPLFIDITGREIKVFGGGKIATRRINTLLLFDGKITVVSPEITEELTALVQNGTIEHERRAYNHGELGGEFMVMAATDDRAVNSEIVSEAREKKILVNNASCRDESDFYFPGVAVQGDLSVGVCGTGNHHGKVRRVTEKIRVILSEVEQL